MLSLSAGVVICLALVGPGVYASPVTGRQAGDLAQRDDVAEKFERFLDRKPFHARAFDQLYSAATAAGGRAALEERYRARLDADPEDHTARVVLARLEARARRNAEALALLEPLGDEQAEVGHLRGRLLFALGRNSEAAGAFASAVELIRTGDHGGDRVLAEQALEELARAEMASGHREAAVAALGEFAELQPESFNQRCEAAARLVDLGLWPEALLQYEVASDLAADDPERVVRAWVAAGELRERSGDAAGADADFARAVRLLGPGHWRRAELFGRRLALHQRAQSLGAFADEVAELAAERAVDPELRIELARVQQALEAEDEALATLDAAARAFPEHLAVARTRAQMLATAGHLDLAIAAYQALAEQHPRERGLRVAAGSLAAVSGRHEVAWTQWQHELDSRPTDVALQLEIAQLAANFGMESRAAELLERAQRTSPGDLRATRALVALTDNPSALHDAERAARERGDADTLEELALEWDERGDRGRAIALVRGALELGGDEDRCLGLLAAMDLEGVPDKAARELLLRHAVITRDPEQRVERVLRFVAALTGPERARWALDESRPVDAESLQARGLPAIDPRLAIAIGAHVTDTDHYATARAALESLAQDPHDTTEREVALRHLAILAEQQRDLPIALRAWTDLGALQPRLRIGSLRQRARILRGSDLPEAAAAVENALLEAAPRDPTVLRDAAQRASKAGERRRAVELFDRLLAVDPRDDNARLSLVRLLGAGEETQRALDELALVLASDTESSRLRARTLLRSRDLLLDDDPELRPMVVALAVQSAEPTLATGLLEWNVLRTLQRESAAATVLRRLAERYPVEGALSAAVIEGFGVTPVTDSMIARAALLGSALGASDRQLVLLQLRHGRRSNARDALRALDPVLASQLLLLDDDPRHAATILRDAVEDAPEDVELLRRSAVAWAAAGKLSRAMAALEAAREALQPSSLARFEVCLALGELAERARSRSSLRKVGAALFQELQVSRALLARPLLLEPLRAIHTERVDSTLEFFLRHGLEREFARAALGTPPQDLALTRALLDAPLDLRASERSQALGRMSVQPFAAYDGEDWRALRERHGAGAEDSKGVRERGRWASPRARPDDGG